MSLHFLGHYTLQDISQMLIQALASCGKMGDQEMLPEEVRSLLEDDGFTCSKCRGEWGRRQRRRRRQSMAGKGYAPANSELAGSHLGAQDS